MAALMLSQIYYWYRPDKSGKSKLRVFYYGKWWIAKSMVEWEKELGITPKQARRCLKLLCDRGILETIIVRFNGAPTTHCRLVSVTGKRILESPERVFPSAQKVQSICPTGQNDLPSEENPFALQVKFLTENTAETTAESTAGAQVKTSPQNQQEEQDMNELQNTLQKIKESEPQTAWGTWNKYMGNLHPEVFQYSPTGKEKGQMKMLVNSLGGPSLGVERLKWMLLHWSEFAFQVKGDKGLNVPMVPNLGFALQHWAVVMQLIAKKEAPPKPTSTHKEVVVSPGIEPEEESPLPKGTKTDSAAILQLLKELKPG